MSDDSRNPLSDPIFRRISRLADAMGVRAYVVGGYVRDYYLGRPSTDIDVVVVFATPPFWFAIAITFTVFSPFVI